MDTLHEDILCRCGRSVFQDYTGLGLCCAECAAPTVSCDCLALTPDAADMCGHGMTVMGRYDGTRILRTWEYRG